ncbi:LOW QUALITY PROTEIN: hypothetical protein Cgig2_011715 [Carnegiea gigantea]|uniref:Zinc finger PMZ-type domain-containing protein n=1 Tax=Carnegiea gigantea TaxID=171969 RepID=A0A9Q1GI98_9CARY|nr:LOW QUALITY PROTEIN: hypothetical protein Cgig2_011715 [Carnegiea gigantea]
MQYSLKCNRLKLLPLGRVGDVKKLMKGNDEYAYLYGVKVRVWDGYMGMKSVKGSQGGGCSNRGMDGATVNATSDVGRGVDGGVVTDHVVRIEMKLRQTLANIGSVADVKLFNTALGEYGVLLINNHNLVVNLAERAYSYKWWQLKGLPCAHAMAVIDKHKLWVYDYVRDCYKAGSQNTIYINNTHPIETHDSATVDNATGLVVEGEALDDGYNRRILPPINPRP